MLKCPFAHGSKTGTGDSDVMAALKGETQVLHDAAEKHPLQHAMVSGQVSREAYCEYLAQFLLIHKALDRRLRENRDVRPFNRILRDGQFRAGLIERDLDFFHFDASDNSPTPATQRMIDRINDAAVGDPLKLLGYHYVLEGSNNGSRFIARAIRKCLDLNDTDGTRFLDPYGDDQPGQWRQFKLDMAACDFDASQIDTLIAAAKEMFTAVYDALDDLHSVQRV